MGVTLTDVLLFGKAQSDDVDNATLVIYRRNILRWSALGGYLDIIVKGISPISLPDAIADSLEYLKAFGGTEQRNIPAEYTQVNYVTNTVRTVVNTGIMIDLAKNYEFEIECRAVISSWFILQSRESETLPNTGISGSGTGSTIVLIVGGISVCRSGITRTLGNRLYVKATLNNGVGTLYVKDITAGTEDTVTGTYSVSTTNPTTPMYLLGNAAGQYADINSRIYMARIKENDTVVMDYVPARQVATAGFYDTVSGTFKTALTPANLSAGGDTVSTPDAPMDIVSNNGVLKFGQYGKNLNVGELDHQGYGSTGAISTVTSFCGTLWKIKVNPGEKYTVSYGNFPDGIQGVYVSTWLADGTWNTRQAFTISGSCTYTVPENVGEVNFTLYKTGGVTIADNSWIQVEAGETATDYEPAHFGLHTDGTVETINVHGKNLFNRNGSGVVAGYYISSDGSLISNPSWNISDYIPIKANTTFTYSTSRPGGLGSAAYLAYYDANRAVISTENQGSNANKTVTTPAGTAYIKVSFANNGDWQVELGSTATDYEPYFDGGTATAEMLLKVDDYQDVQSIIDGAVTRNVGVKVLDGTEEWIVSNGYFSVRDAAINWGYQRNIAGIATVFPFFTNANAFLAADNGFMLANGFNVRPYGYQFDSSGLTAWSNYLADQYAAGTPVIVIYPLATPTTESVAGQALQVQAGDNTIEITQASLDDLEIEAKYQAAVSLTIQEVQDANLDPNVQVTIN